MNGHFFGALKGGLPFLGSKGPIQEYQVPVPNNHVPFCIRKFLNGLRIMYAVLLVKRCAKCPV
jgi:hypothetical protein